MSILLAVDSRRGRLAWGDLAWSQDFDEIAVKFSLWRMWATSARSPRAIAASGSVSKVQKTLFCGDRWTRTTGARRIEAVSDAEWGDRDG